jgi:ubiquinone/menaquinone biosynthesis C-methylase UbiE
MAMADYNEGYYRPHAEHLRLHSRFTRQRISFLNEYASPRAGERILDLGTGVGSMAFESMKSGAEVVGLDFADTALATAQTIGAELGLEPLRLVRGDGTRLPFQASTFDKVICVDFVEHLVDPDYLSMISECRRALVEGGKLFIVCPGPDHIFQVLRRHNLILKREKTHIGFKSIQCLSSSLQEAGFRLETAKVLPSHLPGWQLLERLLIPLPGVGEFFQKTICIIAAKLPEDVCSTRQAKARTARGLGLF